MRIIFISIFVCFSYTVKSQNFGIKVFKSGEDGYKCILESPYNFNNSQNGTLLAFAEGRNK